MAETDIKILGKLVSGTSDKILASTSDIYDDTEGKKQSEINAELKNIGEKLPELHINFNTGEDIYHDFLKISLKDLKNELFTELENKGYIESVSTNGCPFILYLHRKTNGGDLTELLNDSPQVVYGVFNDNSHGLSRLVYLYGIFNIEKQSDKIDGDTLISIPDLYYSDLNIVSVIEINLDEDVFYTWGEQYINDCIIFDDESFLDTAEGEWYIRITKDNWSTFFDTNLLPKITDADEQKLLILKSTSLGKSIPITISKQLLGDGHYTIVFSNCLIQKLSDNSICFGGMHVKETYGYYGTMMYADPGEWTPGLTILNMAPDPENENFTVWVTFDKEDGYTLSSLKSEIMKKCEYFMNNEQYYYGQTFRFRLCPMDQEEAYAFGYISGNVDTHKSHECVINGNMKIVSFKSTDGSIDYLKTQPERILEKNVEIVFGEGTHLNESTEDAHTYIKRISFLVDYEPDNIPAPEGYVTLDWCEKYEKQELPVVEVTCDMGPDYFSATSIASAVYNSVGDNLGPVIIKIIAGESSGFFEPYICYGMVIGGSNETPTEHSLILDCTLRDASSEYSGTKTYTPIFNITETDPFTVTKLQLKPLKASYENDLVVNEMTRSGQQRLVINCEYDESSMPQLSIKTLLDAIESPTSIFNPGPFTIIVNDSTNNANFYISAKFQTTGIIGPSGSDNKEVYIEGPLGLSSTDHTTGIIDLSYSPAKTCYTGFAYVFGYPGITAYPMATPVTSIDGGNA